MYYTSFLYVKDITEKQRRENKNRADEKANLTNTTTTNNNNNNNIEKQRKKETKPENNGKNESKSRRKGADCRSQSW